GTYRFESEYTDEFGGTAKSQKIIIVASRKDTEMKTSCYSLTLSDRNDYTVGDEAQVIIGSVLSEGYYFVEIWAGEFLKEVRYINRGEKITRISIPVEENMKGGFTVRWFGINENRIFRGQQTFSVPWNDKLLDIRSDIPDVMLPGQEKNVSMTVRDNKGRKVSGHALSFMYDASLDYYRKNQVPDFGGIYKGKHPYRANFDSVFQRNDLQFPVDKGLIQMLMNVFRTPPETPEKPRIFEFYPHYGYGSRSFPGSRMGVLRSENVDSFAAGAPELEKAQSDEAKDMSAIDEGSKEPQIRENFADTAFYNADISVKNGKAEYDIKTPDQLSRFNYYVIALTDDVKYGVLKKEVETKKMLMVRADIPRFFREKDIGTIDIMVHNESEKTISGQGNLTVMLDDKDVTESLGVDSRVFSYSIAPHGKKTFSYRLEIPAGIGTYRVKASVRGGGYSDVEIRDLPVYPSRERIVESVIAALKGDTEKTLTIKAADDKTRIDELAVLQLDPQLALTLLNSIPYLIDYSYNCTEQMLNKFVPLSIMMEVFKKYPELRKAAKGIPERDTITLPWEADDDRRQLSLQETPWMWESEGRPSWYKGLSLLDSDKVSKNKKYYLEKLVDAQNSDGGFPWWPGGKSNTYITLYVLEGFAHARRYGVDIPKTVLNRALRYVGDSVSGMLKPEKRSISMVAYASFVLSQYDRDEYSGNWQGVQAVRNWIVFLEDNLYALTPLGKAYLAYTYHNLRNDKRAQELLDMALDGAQEDPLVGVYWTPEKYSWVWYSDTVEKHAFFIRLLNEMRPDDERLPGMVQWLLFNRKGNVWKSTKSSVSAVFSLLDFMEKSGALEEDENISVKWGSVRRNYTFGPSDFVENPVKITKKDEEIERDMSSAVVTKKGKGTAFASLTVVYTTDELPEANGNSYLSLERKIYRRSPDGGGKYKLTQVRSGDSVSVGDEIEVHLKLNTQSQFEYLHLKDPKPAGFENVDLISGWTWDPISIYREIRDSLTNFFIDWMPHGEVILKYRMRPTKPGVYRVHAATVQSMYTPDMNANSAGQIIEVVE
ncbi:MAG: alpha-2-macroglobulin family protein, partial [Candidatus Muiribacteriaceae bacterium]